jgi:putative sporulation protein YyaC
MTNFPLVRMIDHDSFHYEDPFSQWHLEKSVHRLMLLNNLRFERDIVYLCVGTDRSTGDSLGPLVGTHLQQLSSSLNLFGTLEKPSHAINLPDILDQINHRHSNPLVIAIDASLGNIQRIGYINIKPEGLRPGTALNKVLPAVGDFHISAVVNSSGYSAPVVLQNTRLYIVYRMAEIIARSLYLARLRYELDRRRFEPNR